MPAIEYNKYMREYMLRRYYAKRTEAIQYLGGKCEGCGATKELDIDHVEASTKRFTLAKGWSRSWKDLKAELDQCQLLCRPCHILKTRINRENTSGGWNRVDNYDHGSGHMYNKQRCRCESCRTWRRDYRNKRVNYCGTPLPL